MRVTINAHIDKMQFARICILSVFFLVYLSWSLVLPISQGPDEELRLLIPRYIYSHGALPLGFDEAIRDTVQGYGVSYGFAPYGSSLIASFFMWCVSWFTTDFVALTCAARFVSVMCAVASVYLCFKIGDLLFSDKKSSCMLACFCGFLPQFVFVASYFNSDAFSIFCSALVIYAWLFGINNKWSIKACILLGIALGLCALSYYFSYGLILASVFVYLATNFHVLKLHNTGMRQIILRAGFIFLIAFAIAGWFFIRNAQLYDGDFFGLQASRICGELYGIESMKPSALMTPRKMGISPLDMVFLPYGPSSLIWWKYTLFSSIGFFGYMTIKMPTALYAIYILVFLIGAVLAIIFAPRKQRPIEKRIIAVALLLCAIVPLILSIYYSWASDYQPQGRYLATAMIPVMLAVVSGYDGLLKNAKGPNSPFTNQSRRFFLRAWSAHKNAVPVIICAIYAILFLYVVLAIISPYCTGGVMADCRNLALT